MKKQILFFSVGCLIALLFFAGVTDRTRPLTSADQTNKSYVTIGGSAADTIVVSDTVQYPIYVDHTSQVQPYISLYWDKIGSGTATCAVTFWQSNDGTNYYTVKKGKAQSALSKSISGSVDTYVDYSFALDTAVLEGRYLKVKFITTSTASVKAKITGKVKFNTK